MAENIDTRSGKAVAMRGPKAFRNLSADTKAAFLHEGKWREYPTDVDVAKSFAPDNDGRVYITGNGAPQQITTTLANAVEHRRLGLSPPSTALSIAITPQGPPADGAQIEHSVLYTYTRVNRWGEESAPAPETVVVDLHEGQGVILSGFEKPDMAATGEDIVAYRVYRSEAAGFFWIHDPANPEDNDPFHAGDMPAGQQEFTDWDTATSDIRKESYSHLITQTEQSGSRWDPPPADLVGICSHVGGIWAGFTGNTVCVSEMLVPYAWPKAYQKPLGADVVAMKPWNEALIVLTTTYPYVIMGSAPEAMVQQRLPYPQACLSKRSAVTTPYGVLFASPDGLCLCTASSCEVVTEPFMTPAQWVTDFDPARMIGFFHNNRYLGFSTATAGIHQGRGIEIDFRGGDGIMPLALGKTVVGGFQDAASDRLYLILEEDGTRTLAEWEAGPQMRARWASPRQKFRKPVNIACGVVDYEGSLATLDITADDDIQTIYPDSDNSFWLASGFLAYDWRFSVSFTGTLLRMNFGFSKEDLQ